MGNQCCAGRDEAFKRRSGTGVTEGSTDDVVRFDQAYDNNDIAEFCKLCYSECEIEKLEERMHPWAADPETVGSLAATQIAILASREQEPKLKDEIRENGGIKALVTLLKSSAKDRVHAAVVALSFLSVDNSANCREMYNLGAVPHFINGMKVSIDGMRAACAQTCRNIYVLDVKYRKEFLKSGGVTQLLRLLRLPEPLAPNATLYTQLEAIYHLEDFILDGGEELPEFIQAIKTGGVVEQLRILSKCPDPDVAEASKLLLQRLVD